MIKIGICGFGYWGPVLYRNFSANPAFDVVAVADRLPERRERAASIKPHLRVYSDAVEMIDHANLDALAISTPVGTHFHLARHALRKGKHVLVEKPLCERAEQADELIELAKRANLALLVDHVFVFHEAVRMIKRLKDQGGLGELSYFDSLRVNLGIFQSDVNVLWDLAPHDFSIVDHLFGEEPTFLEATGYYHVHPGQPDIVYVTAHYRSRMIAHFNLSWMSPVKVRRVAIGGTKQMILWDDLNSEERVKIYNSGIETGPEEQRILYRIGDIFSPRLPSREALANVVEEFQRAIEGDKKSLIDGDAGRRVVRMLEAAQAALDRRFATLASLNAGADAVSF